MSKVIYDGHEYRLISADDRHLVQNNYGTVVGVIFPSGFCHARPMDGPVENSGEIKHTYVEAVHAINEHINK